MNKLRFLLIQGVSVLALTASAHAQGTGSSGGKATIDEIVVTAQRREQSLMSVPASITAVSGDQLQATGIKEISSLQFNTPGFLPSNGVGYTQIYVRGIGNDIFVGADPSVVTNIDEVPRIYGSMVNAFVNVERVEVLKGAQGGLYGRNASGGVVNIITRKPSTDAFGFDARVSGGSKNTFSGDLFVNIPVSDKVAVTLAGERKTHDPYVKNLATANPLTAAMFPNGGGPVLGSAGVVTPAQTAAFFNSAVQPERGYGNQNFWAFDAKALFKVSDNFKLTVSGDFSRKRDSEGNQWYNSTPAYSQGTAAFILSNFGVTTAFPAGFFKPVTEKFTTYNSTPAAAHLRDYGGSVRADFSGSGVDVMAISAYRAQQTLYSQNYADPITLDIPIVLNKKWYVYEELRATSNGSGPFQYIAGATYLRDHFHGRTTNLLFPPIWTVPIPAVRAGTATFTEVLDDRKNWSVYAQLSYDFSNFSVTASGRYIHETNTAHFLNPVTATANIVGKKFLPSATLSYKLDGGGNIFARYAKGFKAGGVNPVVPPNFFPSDYGKVFAPESVDTYEAGIKTPLFDRAAQVTATVFYNDIKNLQTTSSGNATHPALILAIINAGTARTYGGEVSINWRVSEPLTIGINGSYLNAKYKDFKNTDGSVLNTFNFSNSQMKYAPKWQLAFTADLDQPINDSYRIVGSLLVSYIDRIRGGISTGVNPDPIIPSYWLTNVRLGVRTSDDHYGISIYAKNLFNASYFTFGSGGGLGSNLLWGDPRIVGGELQIKF